MNGSDLFKETTFHHACSLMEDGRYAEALLLLHKLVTDGETGEEVLVCALSSALHTENWDLAKRYAEEIGRQQYEGKDALFWITDYYFGSGQEMLAQRNISQIRQLYPADTCLLWDVAEMLFDYEFRDQYEEILRQIAAVKTQDPLELLDQADAHLALNQLAPAAQKAMEAARNLASHERDDIYYAGLVLEQCGEAGKALQVYEKWLADSPEDVEFLLATVRCHSALGQFDQAEHILEQARQLQPDLPELGPAAKAVAQARRKVIDFQMYRKRKHESGSQL
ncbi:tetratricopeptide repeat protein [Acetonema longum]|uniref:Uncharacterized protein n=1 Tax=Acetonema longum DSM 6540 TaxID=1009370 RepID=F7NMD3_9FIRM|nr:tetratricopeptide repeat protein [Acetonema longum]EGO62809.1 hypothetical protein ALO_16357 [Acetonema longum DSM 6540]